MKKHLDKILFIEVFFLLMMFSYLFIICKMVKKDILVFSDIK